MITIAENIKTLRAANKMTQKELAQKLGVSPSTVGMYENDKRDPDYHILIKLCQIFDVSLDFLVMPYSDQESDPAEQEMIRTLIGLVLENKGRLKTSEDRERYIDFVADVLKLYNKTRDGD